MSKSFKTIIKIAFLIVALVLLFILLIYSRKTYLKNSYPLKYTEFVEKYSAENDIDPYFVYAVIRTESGFDKDATSSVNAKGLMQVTEDTYNWISSKMGNKNRNFDEMYNPETSIKYGAFLLSYLKQNLGAPENILCGYHAGVNQTKKWLNNEKYSNGNIVNIEALPYPDTKQYVKKVMKTYKIYSELYK